MFKNLDGFKKIHEDKDKTVMQHNKGHRITIANRALPALQRKQLQSLPLHECSGGAIKMAGGGKIGHYYDGGKTVPLVDYGQNSTPADVQDYTPVAQGTGVGDQFNRIAANNLPTTPVPAAGPANESEAISDELGVGKKSQEKQPPAPVADEDDDTQDDTDKPPVPAPVAAPPAGQPGQQSFNPNDIIGLESAGIKGQANAESQLAQAQLATEQNYQKQMADENVKWQAQQQQMFGQIGSSLQDVKNGHINPNQYMENMSSGQKVSTAIGLFLGGLSSAFTHQGNPAMDMLNKQIDRDIDAQKTGLNNKMNIYHAYLDQYHNAAAAENMTRATQLGIYGSQLREAAAKSGDPLAQARAKIGLAQIQQQMYPLIQNAQLNANAAKFNGTSPQNGSEPEFQSLLSNSQRAGSPLYKDLQEKYIPGVGVTKIPVQKEDISELSTYKNLNDLAKQAQDFAQTTGRTLPGTNANQKANDIANQLRLQIGQLVNLKRINEYEAKKYDDLVRSPGAWNQGSAIQSFKDLRSDIAGKTQSLGQKLGITPFRR